jgi:hypothetical protein
MSTMSGDRDLDVELTDPGTFTECEGQHILEGIVFERLSGQPRGVAGTYVSFCSTNRFVCDVHTYTDAEGRYRFGNLPPGRGTLYAGWCDTNDTAMDFSGVLPNSRFDADISSLVAACATIRRQP